MKMTRIALIHLTILMISRKTLVHSASCYCGRIPAYDLFKNENGEILHHKVMFFFLCFPPLSPTECVIKGVPNFINISCVPPNPIPFQIPLPQPQSFNESYTFPLPRITKGIPSDRHSIPWQAYILVHQDIGTTSSCGGVLFSHEWVLTAGHCVKYVPIEKFLSKYF